MPAFKRLIELSGKAGDHGLLSICNNKSDINNIADGADPLLILSESETEIIPSCKDNYERLPTAVIYGAFPGIQRSF